MTAQLCAQCHHHPSRRIAEDGAECQCGCHDIADASPELARALLGCVRAMVGLDGFETEVENGWDALKKARLTHKWRDCTVKVTVEDGKLHIFATGCDDRCTILFDQEVQLPEPDKRN